MPKYILTYKFHLYTINFKEKEITEQIQTFTNFELLLAEYRRLKSVKAYDIFDAYSDFKLFSVNTTEIDIDTINQFL